MARGVSRIVFVSVLVGQCLLWSNSRYSDTALDIQTRPSLAAVLKRGVFDYAISPEDDCAPLAFPPEDQCAHVQLDVCPHANTALSIQYLQSYFCTKPSLRVFHFAALLSWLVFLFTTLGISASDFFCPNLATIAQELGLDENVAGVTFLAWGNGSPDVFSTFSALRADSGSLAVGELLGAASFITSCVVGSMCIIKPFKVEPYPFLRDVGFFTASVALLLAILRDGMINEWEALVLVVLYLVYVSVVVAGSWWERRKERTRRTEALLRAEFGPDEPYHDEPYEEESSPNHLAIPTAAGARSRSSSNPGPLPPLTSSGTVPSPSRRHSYSVNGLSNSQPNLHTTPPRMHHLPSFSLLGALEFRDVVTSLKAQSTSETLQHFERTPLPQYLSASVSSLSHHRHARMGDFHSPSTRAEEIDPWDAALVGSGDRLPLNERTLQNPTDLARLDQQAFMARVDSESSLDSLRGPDSPIITRTPASPTLIAGESLTSLPQQVNRESSPSPSRQSRRINVWRAMCAGGRLLFPTLVDLRSKSWAGRVVAVFAAPAVLALTVTLPVVETPYEYGSDNPEKGPRSSQLITFEGDSETEVEQTRAEAALAIAENNITDHPGDFNRFLVAGQCVLGPLFCISVLFGRTHVVLLIAAAICGIATAALVVVFADIGNDHNARISRCFMGFMIAMIWIMAIADEVVNVLDTFGYIFGLSDAIVGLTIFAAGNSLADLVANMSVAVFAPIMGFSACFGSPMLNILLGVGLSGSYMINKSGRPYELKFSRTLLTSSIGLLILLVITLIFVPLNGYFLSRRWGIFLIVAYCVMMAANIYTEVTR